MNLRSITVKDCNGKCVSAQEAVCDVCDGNSFHITVINGHNHLICANPSCQECFCQIEHPECVNPTITVEVDPFSPSCPYCGSGLIQDGDCAKCGL